MNFQDDMLREVVRLQREVIELRALLRRANEQSNHSDECPTYDGRGSCECWKHDAALLGVFGPAAQGKALEIEETLPESARSPYGRTP